MRALPNEGFSVLYDYQVIKPKYLAPDKIVPPSPKQDIVAKINLKDSP